MGVKTAKGSDREIPSFRLVSVLTRAGETDEAPPEPSPGMRACLNCGEESPERYRHCIVCGASLVTATVARENRRTVTIVFANPKPSTDTGEPLAPDAFTDVMTAYFEVMKAALERHGGTVEKF